MSYQWVEPELFLEHDGVEVYHCYDDNGTVSYFWYTIDPQDDNYDWAKSDSAQFDVRELPNLGLDVNDFENHPAIIRQAIQENITTGESHRLTVVIEVQDGVAEVVEKPPGVEVKIIDHDLVDEHDPCSPDMAQMPSVETLMQWDAEGMCKATDGCIVEPDGVCSHGCQSWLLVMGLI